VGILLTVIAIIGSYSRGALVGLVALGLLAILRVRNRFAYQQTSNTLISDLAAQIIGEWQRHIPSHYWGERVVTIEGYL
jgi:hypothetical protein